MSHRYGGHTKKSQYVRGSNTKSNSLFCIPNLKKNIRNKCNINTLKIKLSIPFQIVRFLSNRAWSFPSKGEKIMSDQNTMHTMFFFDEDVNFGSSSVLGTVTKTESLFFQSFKTEKLNHLLRLSNYFSYMLFWSFSNSKYKQMYVSFKTSGLATNSSVDFLNLEFPSEKAQTSTWFQTMFWSNTLVYASVFTSNFGDKITNVALIRNELKTVVLNLPLSPFQLLLVVIWTHSLLHDANGNK